MDRKLSIQTPTVRKLSNDVHRKLSAISNCSDISNLSVKLGMDPGDFKSTIQSILDLDQIDGWSVGGCGSSDEDDDMACYGEETAPKSTALMTPPTKKMHQRKPSEVVTISVDNRKSSTGSQSSTADSLDGADDFVPVTIDVETLKQVIGRYKKHSRKLSTTAVITKPTQ